MPELLKAPVTPAQQARDTLLGALVGLARATTNEPKTDDTDEVLNAGLRLAAQPDAPEERLQRMLGRLSGRTRVPAAGTGGRTGL